MSGCAMTREVEVRRPPVRSEGEKTSPKSENSALPPHETDGALSPLTHLHFPSRVTLLFPAAFPAACEQIFPIAQSHNGMSPAKPQTPAKGGECHR